MKYALYLAWRNLMFYFSSTVINVILFFIAGLIISTSILIQNSTENMLSNNIRGVDLVVGAKGNPMQIILSGIFHVDNPTGNIPLNTAQELSLNPLVKQAVPISIGDNYQGIRIVGTNETFYSLYDLSLKSGSWNSQPMEAVVGSQVAQKLQLSLGDQFESTHGLDKTGFQTHNHEKFKVVGILNPSHTVADNLILTSVESYWVMHHQNPEDENLEITSLLVTYKSPAAMTKFPMLVKNKENLIPASPAKETARLISLFGIGIEMIQIIALIFIILSCLSLTLGLFNSLKSRKGELKIIRGMGGSPSTAYLSVLFEGGLTALVGIIPGILATPLLVLIINRLELFQGFSLPLTLPLISLWLIPCGLIIGFIAALPPAFQAYRR
jgi:putative ABC transport system permease protein